MANNTSRGGKKQSTEKQRAGKKHQGVRPGSTATRKERHQVEKRKPVIDEEQERKARSKGTKTASGKSAKQKRNPAAKKVRAESPEKRATVKAGTGKKNLYANMPKARKVR